jgi:hypothetical protein
MTDLHCSGLSALAVLAHCQGFLFLTLLLLDPVKHLERNYAARFSRAGQPT